MKRFTFWQNNSGGYYVGPHYFVCVGENEKVAWDILKQQSWYTDKYCSCCGPRWTECWNDWDTDPNSNNEALDYVDREQEVIDLTKENVNG